jgi:hypothetical protein
LPPPDVAVYPNSLNQHLRAVRGEKKRLDGSYPDNLLAGLLYYRPRTRKRRIWFARLNGAPFRTLISLTLLYNLQSPVADTTRVISNANAAAGRGSP